MDGCSRSAQRRRVIAVEMQGHGRAVDMDRPMSFPTMGDDIAVLFNYLRIPKADLVGQSFGRPSAPRPPIQHRDRARRMVVISSHSARSGWNPDAQRGISQVSAVMAESLMQTATGQFSQQWPEPRRQLQVPLFAIATAVSAIKIQRAKISSE